MSDIFALLPRITKKETERMTRKKIETESFELFYHAQYDIKGQVKLSVKL